MSCFELFKGQDANCVSWGKRYYQQVVLVNKSYIDEYSFQTAAYSTSPSVGLDSGYVDPDTINYRHRINFNLKQSTRGVLFNGELNGLSYFANFSKEIEDNIPQYNHFLQLPIFGASEKTKYTLKTLDFGDYFAAIQFNDGTVEIYGFENGLTSGDYTYDLQGNLGGSIISLESRDLENDPPFVYYSNNPNEDFNNLFQYLEPVTLGDFNDDFSNDFNTIE